MNKNIKDDSSSSFEEALKKRTVPFGFGVIKVGRGLAVEGNQILQIPNIIDQSMIFKNSIHTIDLIELFFVC